MSGQDTPGIHKVCVYPQLEYTESMTKTPTLADLTKRLHSLAIELSDARDDWEGGEEYGWDNTAQRDWAKGKVEMIEDDIRGLIYSVEVYLGV